MSKVLIEMEGGVIQNIYTNIKDLEVQVLDHDTEGITEPILDEVEVSKMFEGISSVKDIDYKYTDI